ncbi:hypothetical protein ACJX0J_007925, partial [Zea mays]
ETVVRGALSKGLTSLALIESQFGEPYDEWLEPIEDIVWRHIYSNRMKGICVSHNNTLNPPQHMTHGVSKKEQIHPFLLRDIAMEIVEEEPWGYGHLFGFRSMGHLNFAIC